MAARKTVEDKVIDAMLALVADHGWFALTLSQIAREAKVPLADLHLRFSDKNAILTAYSRRLDVTVLRGIDPEDLADERLKDRLFDILMARFDEMQKHRGAIERLARDLSRDPLSILQGRRPVLRAMRWMLDGAEIEAEGLRGAVRVRALAAVWFAAFRVWLEDGQEMNKTMAELDRRLDQASTFWGADELTPEETDF